MTRWKLKLIPVFLFLLAGVGLLRHGLDWVSYYTALMDLFKGLKALINSPLIFPLLLIAGIVSFIWISYLERKRKQALPEALIHVATEDRSVGRDGLGYTINGVGSRAVIVWFENQSKYKLERVRALMYFAVDRDKRIDYSGLWLDESWKDIQFDPKERKGLILIMEQDGKYVAPSERRELEHYKLMPEFHPIGEETCIIHLTLSIEGASSNRQPRFQIRQVPQLEVLTFWH
jgi:preprotein translocase subunit YajC